MSTESFEQAMEIARHVMCEECELIDNYGSLCRSHDDSCHDCEKSMVARLKAAHDREIRDVSQREFARGMDAGKHSMDAEHRAIAMHLRGLRFDGGSHENLAKIAYAIYPCATGWTCESADGLRDRLIDLMGGVSDDTSIGAGGGACDADCGCDSGVQVEVTDERLADDSGADTGGWSRGDVVHMAGVRITDELRKLPPVGRVTCNGMELDTPEEYIVTTRRQIDNIADRIDAQIRSLCQQKESTCRECMDEYDRMHVELPRDKNGEVFRVDGGARVNDLVLTIRQMTLTRSGWKIRAYDEDYEVERESSFFEVCAPKPDLIEEIIEKLTLGEITQSEAIERIKSLGQE